MSRGNGMLRFGRCTVRCSVKPHDNSAKMGQTRRSRYVNMRTQVMILSALIFPAHNISAQCAPGIPGAGNPGCIPPTQPNSPYSQGSTDTSTPTQGAGPVPVWRDSWGAIAVDASSGKAGMIENAVSKSVASAEALERCRSEGGKSCSIQLTYFNQCAAIAQERAGGMTRMSSDASQREAERRAVENCGGERACEVVFSRCSNPVRIQ